MKAIRTGWMALKRLADLAPWPHMVGHDDGQQRTFPGRAGFSMGYQ
jgi:hypothetical protein